MSSKDIASEVHSEYNYYLSVMSRVQVQLSFFSKGCVLQTQTSLCKNILPKAEMYCFMFKGRDVIVSGLRSYHHELRQNFRNSDTVVF